MQNAHRVIPFRLRRHSPHLVACAVCLRVRGAEGWIDAAEAIRRLRTFEHDQVVRLAGALCDHCETELRARRPSGAEDLAA